MDGSREGSVFNLLKIRNKRSAIKASLVTTAVSVVLSVCACLLSLYFSGNMMPEALVVAVPTAALTPLLLAFPISYYVFNLMLKLEESKKQIEILTRFDHLTGVYNRRYFTELAEREISRAQRYDYAASLLMIDLDKFKRINDTHGHLAGDQVLKEVVDTCVKTVRQTDILGRFGGEEFVLILPRTTTRQAEVLAERIRQAVEKRLIKTPTADLHITVSLGIGSMSPPDISLQELIRLADTALYTAKENGRNRFETFLDSLC